MGLHDLDVWLLAKSANVVVSPTRPRRRTSQMALRDLRHRASRDLPAVAIDRQRFASMAFRITNGINFSGK